MSGSEIEAKFRILHPERIELRLLEMKAQLIQARVHEFNLRYDSADGRMRQAQEVLRLRRDDQVRLTFKGPSVDTEGGVPGRREIEFSVGDFEAARQFLDALGFVPILSYEKRRATYDLDGVHFMLDELPYGNFIEIEGPDSHAIHAAADRLGLNWGRMVKMGYHALYGRFAAQYGLDPTTLSFENLRGIRVDLETLGILPADE